MSRYVKVDDVMALINTSNRGNCDYFIVDKIEELCNSNNVSEFDEVKVKTDEKKIEKLQKMAETLEMNLSSANQTVLDEYEKYKYQAHCQCLRHLKEILNKTEF